jgi:hypothetical protein
MIAARRVNSREQLRTGANRIANRADGVNRDSADGAYKIIGGKQNINSSNAAGTKVPPQTENKAENDDERSVNSSSKASGKTVKREVK